MSLASIHVSNLCDKGAQCVREIYCGFNKVTLPKSGLFQLQECCQINWEESMFQCAYYMSTLYSRQSSSLKVQPWSPFPRMPLTHQPFPLPMSCRGITIWEIQHENHVARTLQEMQVLQLKEQATHSTSCCLRSPPVTTAYHTQHNTLQHRQYLRQWRG